MALFAWDFELPDLDKAVRDALSEESNLTLSERETLIADVDILSQSYYIHNYFVVVALVVAVIFTLLTLSRMVEIKKYGYFRTKNALSLTYTVDRVLWEMLGVDIFAIGAGVMMALTYSGLVDSENAYCSVMWKVCILFYIMFNHCLYFVMIRRAKAVLNASIFREYYKLQKLAWFVEMANYSLFLIYPLPFFTMGYVSLPPHKVCMVYSSPAISIFVALADTSFSILLLTLFVVPLLSIDKHRTEMYSSHNTPTTVLDTHSNEGTEKQVSTRKGTKRVQKRSRSNNVLRHTIRRQCFLSAVALTSTFVMTTITTLANGLAGTPTLENVATQVWRSWISVAFHTDLACNVVAIHFICFLWVPKWLHKQPLFVGSGRSNTRPTVTRNNTAGSTIVTMQTAGGDESMIEFEVEMPRGSAV